MDLYLFLFMSIIYFSGFLYYRKLRNSLLKDYLELRDLYEKKIDFLQDRLIDVETKYKESITNEAILIKYFHYADELFRDKAIMLPDYMIHLKEKIIGML